MKKMNNYIWLGAFFNGIWIFSIRFNLFSDLIEGLILGFGLLFVLMGMCYEKYDLSKVKNYKKNLLSRVITK